MVGGEACDQCVHVVFGLRMRLLDMRGGLVNRYGRLVSRGLRAGGPQRASNAHGGAETQGIILGAHQLADGVDRQPFRQRARIYRKPEFAHRQQRQRIWLRMYGSHHRRNPVLVLG